MDKEKRMGQLGIGAMLGVLGGNKETVDTIVAAKGKKIIVLALVYDRLNIGLDDGSSFVMFDDGQSCCENRYMQTDDKLPEYIGATFDGAELRDAPHVKQDDDYGDHEVQFLVINTSRGDITFATHNEHNGYYGGFHVVAKPTNPQG